MAEKNFANGLYFKTIKTKYGEMIKLSIKVDEITKQQNDGGYVNTVIKKSKAGTYYAELDLWKPKEEQGEDVEQTEFKENIPF